MLKNGQTLPLTSAASIPKYKYELCWEHKVNNFLKTASNFYFGI